MQAFKILGLLLLAAVLAIVALVLLKVTPRIQPALSPVISTYDECVAAGNAVMPARQSDSVGGESYPRQCRTEDGRLFVEEVPDQPTSNDGLGLQANGCAVAGCSGQLCVFADAASTIITTCEYRAEYACYKEALCEPQADGTCGWTQTTELKQCLANPPALDGDLKLEVL